MICFFFFFQAEDGIRDIGVTGVQTCALPIWPVPRRHPPERGRTPRGRGLDPPRRAARPHRRRGVPGLPATDLTAGPATPARSEERRVGEEGRSRWAPDP